MDINKKFMGCFGRTSKKCDCTAIVIHHSCTASSKRTREVLKSKDCSTHFEIERDGTIYQYREENLQCSHCGSSNCHCIGIDLTHLVGQEFTDPQLRSLKDLLKYLCDKWGITYGVHETLDGIYFHRALGNTVCPDNLRKEQLN